jgi:hypothetical protein
MNVEAESHTILRGRRLPWARIAWIMVTLVLFGLVRASWPPYIRLLLTVCETCEMTPAYAESLQAKGISLTSWAIFLIIPSIIVYMGWMGIGTLIFLLRSNDRRALLLSALLVLVGASFGETIGFVDQYLPEWVWVDNIITILSFPAMIALIYLFPNSVFKPRWLAWLLGLQTLFFLPIQFENLNFPIAYNFIVLLSFVISCIGVPLYRYQRVKYDVAQVLAQFA